MAVSKGETVGVSHSTALGLVAWGLDDSSAPRERERALLRKRGCPLAGNTSSDGE